MPYSPTTWTSGLTLSVAALNNLEAGVVAAPSRVNTVAITPVAAISTTSATFVDITGLTMSVVTIGGDLLVLMEGGACSANGSTGIVFGISVNGVDYPVCTPIDATTVKSPFGGHVVVTGLAAGTYTVKGRFRQQSGGSLSVMALDYNATTRPSYARLTSMEYRR